MSGSPGSPTTGPVRRSLSRGKTGGAAWEVQSDVRAGTSTRRHQNGIHRHVGAEGIESR